jgi:two-component system response regulator AtoC
MAERLLLVEDRESLRRLLARALAERFDVEEAGDGATAIARLHEGSFAVVVTDVRLGTTDGMEVLAAARSVDQPPEVVLMTAYAEVPAAVAALKAGAYDYLSKPVEVEHLLRVVSRAAERWGLLRRTRQLEALVATGEPGFLGVSPAAAEVRRRIERAGRVPAPLLLVGEAGTGRELVARQVHAVRGEGAFVAVSCGGSADAWLETQLFSGLAGTLFLDDVDALSPHLQARLSRLAAEEAGIRVIAATSADLERRVSEGAFRGELYFWLAVQALHLPPLRERREDIPVLAARFLGLAAARFGTRARGLSADALATLEAAPWPGNVRELRHAIERAATTCEGEVVEVEHLPDALRGAAPRAPQGTWRAAVDRAADAAGREYLQNVLRGQQGNVTRAAAEAGVERETLHRLLRRYGIDPARYRP